MKLTLTARALISIALGAALLTPFVATAAESGVSTPGTPNENANERSLAKFEGKTLDLSKSWGDATACWVDQDLAVECFRTEKQLERAIDKAGLDRGLDRGLESERPSDAEGFRAAASCNTSLSVYSGTWYNGYTLYLSARWSWINMSWYGFDNVVSSYRIGTCSSTFRSLSWGGGTTYWGNTSKWSWKPSTCRRKENETL